MKLVAARATVFLGLALFVLAGCGAPQTLEPAIVTRPVDVAVAVKCTPSIGAEPQYADSDSALRAAANLFERVKLLLAGRLQRIQRDKEKSAALAACGVDPQ